MKGQSNKRLISMDEVKQHQTEGSMWTVLKGRVYNLSPYLKFHPGGVCIILCPYIKYFVILVLHTLIKIEWLHYCCFLQYLQYVYDLHVLEYQLFELDMYNRMHKHISWTRRSRWLVNHAWSTIRCSSSIGLSIMQHQPVSPFNCIMICI